MAQGYYISLNGARAVKVDLTIPYQGMALADVELAVPGTFTGPQALVLGNLTLTGTAIRTAPFAGARDWRGVAG